jgi:hypothetical protein
MCEKCCSSDSKLKSVLEKVPDSESFVTKQNRSNYGQIENRIADLVNERLSQFLSETLKPLEQSFLSALEIQDKGHNELSDTIDQVSNSVLNLFIIRLVLFSDKAF